MSTLTVVWHVTAEEGENGDLIAIHGVSAGDVSQDKVIIWSRAERNATMHVHLTRVTQMKKSDKKFSHGKPVLYKSIPVSAENDFTGKIEFTDLSPGTNYSYAVWFTENGPTDKVSKPLNGKFRTAPRMTVASNVKFAWGGDLGGQNVCRDKQEGFPIFRSLAQMDLDFFIGLGDMIYADGSCKKTGRYGNSQIRGEFIAAADLPAYWAHWKYNREDAGLQALLAETSYYAVWDDHEVVNDFGPLHDTRENPPYTSGIHLLPIGLSAFLDYNPVDESRATPKQLYRNIRWGKHLELFILDNRQYRDANLAIDRADRPKTMLGREQLAWLKTKLRASDATWKVIVSSVPLSIPTGHPPESGRDGWANYDQDTGFERELLDILRFMQANAMSNIVFVTTDVHFAEVLAYTPFADAPTFRIHEIVTGPLNAGLFPKRMLDESLAPQRLFIYAPKTSKHVKTYAQAKPWFNFGSIEVDAAGHLRTRVHDVSGKSVYQLDLQPK